MKTTYKITAAHSGTDSKEIEKAKRYFRKILNVGGIAKHHLTPEIHIEFSDVNNCITARFFNEIGQEVCGPLEITLQ